MAKSQQIERSGGGTYPAAEVSVHIGTRVTFDARMTSVGLLSVGVLVSGILLSTAVVVLAAGQNRRKRT